LSALLKQNEIDEATKNAEEWWMKHYKVQDGEQPLH